MISFHGSASPGVLIGGVMVDLAYRNLKEKGLFDVLCETSKCLPDAVQLLTPCTVGNGWLKIFDIGRFALCLYEKKSGSGVRVSIDPFSLSAFPLIKNWFFRINGKEAGDISSEIREALYSIYNVKRVSVDLSFFKKEKRPLIFCPHCKEPFPSKEDKICKACGGLKIYKKEVEDV